MVRGCGVLGYGYDNCLMTGSKWYRVIDWDRVCLDVDMWALSAKELRAIYLSQQILDNGWSLRQLEINIGLSSSTIHRDLRDSLRRVSFEQYQKVDRLLRSHKLGTMYCIKRKMEENKKKR